MCGVTANSHTIASILFFDIIADKAHSSAHSKNKDKGICLYTRKFSY